MRWQETISSLQAIAYDCEPISGFPTRGLQGVHERNLAGTLQDSYEDCNTFNDGIAYFLTVDASGQVTDATANGSGIYSGGEWDTYVPLLRKLRFTPGRIRGHAIECRVLAKVDHTFIERAS